jgi:hypothetical protein
MGRLAPQQPRAKQATGGGLRGSIIRTLDPFLNKAAGARLLDSLLKVVSLPSTLLGGATQEAEKTLAERPPGRISNVGAGFAALGRGAASELAKVGRPDQPQVGVFDVLSQKSKTNIDKGLALAFDVLVGAGVELGFLRGLGKLGLFGKRVPKPRIKPKAAKIDPVKNIYTSPVGDRLPLPKLGSVKDQPVTFYNSIKRGLSSTDANLRGMGKSGDELATRLNRLSFEAERSFGEDALRLRSYKKVLTPAEQVNLFDVLDGQAKPVNNLVAKLSAFERQQLDDLAAEAQRLGIEVRTDAGRVPFKPRKDFAPHIYSKELTSKIQTSPNFRNQLAQRFVDEGRATTFAEAEELVNGFKKFKIEHRFGNLQAERKFDLPGYEQSIEALEQYYKGARFKLAETRLFGARDRIAKQLLSNIEKEGGDRIYAREVWRRFVGLETFQNQETTKKVARAIANFETMTGIANPSTAVLNSTQILSVPLRANIKSLAKGFITAMRRGSSDDAVRSGALINDFRKELLGGGMDLSNLSDKLLRAGGFSATEQFNRIVSNEAGQHFAREMFAIVKRASTKADDLTKLKPYKALKRLNFNVESALKRGYLTKDDMLRAGKTIADETQLRARVLDIPLWASSPEGKVAFQFKTFIFNHGRLLKKAIKDNPANLIYILGSAEIGGEFAQDIRALLKGQDPFGEGRPKGLNRLVDNLAALGAAGIFFDLWQSTVFGSTLGFFAGPGAQDVAAFIEDLTKAMRGDPTPLVKRTTGKIPIVGRTLRGLAFPPRR